MTQHGSRLSRIAALEKANGGEGPVCFVLHTCQADRPAGSGNHWTCAGCGLEVFTLDLGNMLNEWEAA